MNDETWLERITWTSDGLVPVIAQEAGSGDVLMLAWMNRDALRQTLRTRQAVYWSRSRQRLWLKGETSGHIQQVQDVRLDCDGDALLLTVVQTGHTPGIACHTGRHTCFFDQLQNGDHGPTWVSVEPVLKAP